MKPSFILNRHVIFALYSTKFQEITLRGRLRFRLVFDLVQNIIAFQKLCHYVCVARLVQWLVRKNNELKLRKKVLLTTFQAYLILKHLLLKHLDLNLLVSATYFSAKLFGLFQMEASLTNLSYKTLRKSKDLK